MIVYTNKIRNILCEHDENIAAGMIKQRSYEAIAPKYDMCAGAIGSIVRGDTWKDDPGRLQYEAEKDS